MTVPFGRALIPHPSPPDRRSRATQATTALMAIVGSLLAVDASAQLTYCNATPVRIFTAFGYLDQGEWTSIGWYSLEPDECSTVFSGRLTRRKYYTYAETAGATRRWGGTYPFCTRQSAFTIRGDERCEQRGFQATNFDEVDVGDALSHTLRFTCSDCEPLAAAVTFPVPELSVSWTIGQHQVRMPVTGQLRLGMEGRELVGRLTATGDLSDLQRIIPALVRAQLNHQDDCDYVLNMHTVRLTPSGADALLFAAGHYEHWECVEIFGVDAGKHRLFEQNGDVTVRVQPHIAGGDVQLSTALERVTADGLLGGILGSDVFGPWLWNSLEDVMPSSVRVATLRDLYPPELRSYRLRVYGVSFRDLGGGRLGLTASAVVTVGPEQAARLFRQLGGQ